MFTALVGTSAGSANATSVTTPAIDTSGADLLVVAVAAGSGSAANLTDTKGNTWTLIRAQSWIQLYYAKPTAAQVGAGHTFTFSVSGAAPSLAVRAYKGVAAGAPVDQQNGANLGAGTTAIGTGPITPTEANELLITVFATGDPYPGTPDSLFTKRESVTGVGGACIGVDFADQIQTTATTRNVAWSYAGSNAPACVIASLKTLAAVPLAGTVTLAITTTAALTAPVALAGAAAVVVSSSALLTVSGPLLASVTVTITTPRATLQMPAPLAGVAPVVFTTAADLLTSAGLQATGAIVFSSSAALSTQIGIAGAASVTIGTAATLSAGAAQFQASAAIVVTTPAATLTAPVRISGTAAIRFTATLFLGNPLEARTARIVWSSHATITPSPRGSTIFVTLGGADVSHRVRRNGVEVRDILNDTPNTARLVLEGDPVPEVGQRLTITLDTGNVRLFDGTIQSVDRTYQAGRPVYTAWPVHAIDDTAWANMRRPFGSWVNVSASTVAAAIAASFAPAFLTRFEAGLPEVTITFDGTETLIAALVRLAGLVGGYAKVEAQTLILFVDDTADPPDPIDAAHRFLNDPPIAITIDDSQIRTRVYGKGYGEPIPTDVAAGETILPLSNGVLFTPAGGKAIAGTTPDGAQWQLLAYTGVVIGAGGTLVGPGAGPSAALALGLLGGAGVTTGFHEVTVVHVTAAGASLPGPVAAITVGEVAPPLAAPLVNPAVNGTGPDEGSHDYVVTFVLSFGETTPGPVSNAQPTSASVGQLDPPGAPAAGFPGIGTGVDPGSHDYVATFVNAKGETQAGAVSNGVYSYADYGGLSSPGGPGVQTPTQGAGPEEGYTYDYLVTFVTAQGETLPSQSSGPISTNSQVIGAQPPVSPPAPSPSLAAAMGGGLNVNGNQNYYYALTYTTAQGETTLGNQSSKQLSSKVDESKEYVGTTFSTNRSGGGLTVGATYFYRSTSVTAQGETVGSPLSPGRTVATGDNAISVGYGGTSDARVTSRKIYRRNGSAGADHLIQTLSGNGGSSTGQFYDLASDASIAGAAAPPTTSPVTQETAITLTGLTTSGDARVTGRKLYRSIAGENSPRHLLATIGNNTQTSWSDTASDASIQNGAPPPTSDSTAIGGTLTPFHQIPVYGIAIGPAGTIARRLYRRSSSYRPAGALVAELANNSQTTFLDTVPNGSLGTDPPSSNTTGSPYQRIPVSNIPVGPAGTTSRRLYRRFNGGGPFKLVTSIGNNSDTGYTDTRTNASLGVTAPTSNTTGTAVQQLPIVNLPIGPVGTIARNLYRRFNGGGPFKLVSSIGNNTQTTFNDGVSNAALGVTYPTVNTAKGNQINVTAIPIGPAVVIRRELYMSLVGGGTRRLALTIPNNTDTTAIITIADAALAGAAVEPSQDTSGLQQPSGQINAGSTTLIVASTGPFRSAGGWVTLGAQVVRYTGISGSTLTGIPPAGPGAIKTPVLYGQQALPTPMLIGVSGLVVAAADGSAIHIWVQRDDLAAQAEEAARAGTDGIVEYLLTDTRRAEASLTAQCDAQLALYGRPIITARYATRDPKTRSGKPITIALTTPPINTVLTIQEVTITEIDQAPHLMPRYTVLASSVRFSLEDTLRRLVAATPSLERV